MKRNCATSAVTLLMAIAITLTSFVQTTFAQNDQRTAFAVLLDTSGSMAKKSNNPTGFWGVKIIEVKKQIGGFLTSLPPGTAVKLYTFDETLVSYKTITVSTNSDRQKLQKVFDDINPTGKYTNLWEHLDTVMTEMAKAAAENPGRPIRLLVYTDGENNPSHVGGPTLTDVLEKHSDVLKNHVQLTYVTLGFELKADVKKAMVDSNIDVVPSMTPDQLIPLVPEFSWSPRIAIVDEQVQYVDHTGGVVRNQLTTFGDGEESTLRSPAHVYHEPGDYFVCLTVTSSSGETRSVTKTVRVVEREAITAKFDYRPKSVEIGQEVHFTNLTKGDGVSYAWDLGDGAESSLAHPSHTYQSAGTYTPTLVVTDAYGQTTRAVHSVTVSKPVVEKPIALFTVPETVEYDSTTRLTTESTGTITSCRWLVNGKEVASSKSFEFAGAKIGLNKVKLEVAGPGGKSTCTKDIVVNKPGAPVANLVVGSANPRMGDQLVLTDMTTGPHTRSVLTINGRTIERDYTVAGTSRTFELIMDSAGASTFKFEAFGPGGLSATTESVDVKAKHIAPVAKISVERTSGRGSLKTKVVNESKGGPIYRSVYDFGNGKTIEKEGIEGFEHTFDPGHYKVKVTVYGADEFTPSTSETVLIDVAKPYPKWVKSLWWSVPSSLLGLAAMSWMGFAAVGKLKDLSLTKIDGTLEVVDSNGQREEFTFEGRRSRETVDLLDGSKVSLSCFLDPETNDIAYLCERVDGLNIDSASLEARASASLGEMSVTFHPTL